MADKIVTNVFINRDDDAVINQIQKVMAGEVDCAEFVGFDRRSGTEVSVRFQLDD